MDATIRIRPAAPEDHEAVLILTTAFATSFAVEASAFSASFTRLLANPDAYLAVATDGDAVIGYVLGFVHDTLYANGPVAWVEEITVAEPSRRSGVGRMLMDGVEQWAAQRQAKLVALATRRAAAFYQSLDYSESAVYFRKLL